jgi:hypothetical protein
MESSSSVEKMMEEILADINSTEIGTVDSGVNNILSGTTMVDVNWENNLTVFNNALQLAYNQHQDTTAFTCLYNMVFRHKSDIQTLCKAMTVIINSLSQQKEQEEIQKQKKMEANRIKASQRAEKRKKSKVESDVEETVALLQQLIPEPAPLPSNPPPLPAKKSRKKL